MKKKLLLTENIITKCFLAIAAVVFLALSYYSFFYSYYEINYETEKFMNYKDNLFVNLAGVLIAFIMLFGLIYFGKKVSDSTVKKLLAAVLVVSIVFGFYWFSCHAWLPDADQYNVHQIAEMVSRDDYGSFVKWGYASVFQHQWGFIFFLEILYRIFGFADYNIFIILNILMIPVIIASGFYIVGKISDNNKFVKLIYLVFLLVCIPLYGYIPQVYGEMVSVAAILVGTVILISLVERFTVWKSVGLALVVSFAVQMRQNSLIYVIAVMIVLIFLSLFRKNWRYLLTACACVVFLIGSNGIVRGRYETFASDECVNMPSILWVSMGLHDTAEGPGWFDGSSTNVFMYQTDFNVELSEQIAKEDINTSIRNFMDNPGYAFDFFRRKILSQWNAPMYQAFCANFKNVKEEAHGLVRVLYFDEGKVLTENFMNIYQLAVYLGVFSYCVWAFRNKAKLDYSLLLITVFGGFLFSIMWEAKARYIFPYFIFMLPHAVIGLEKAAEAGLRIVQKFKAKRENEE